MRTSFAALEVEWLVEREAPTHFRRLAPREAAAGRGGAGRPGLSALQCSIVCAILCGRAVGGTPDQGARVQRWAHWRRQST